ncbi:MAG: chemotaxis protein CheW [Terriglobales bacterium]
MRISKKETRRARSAPREAMILFTVGPTTLAIAAGAVEEIRNIEGLEPFAPSFKLRSLAQVKHTLARGARSYFVVDAAAHFGVASARPTRLLLLRHAPVAVQVENVARMAEIATLHALPRAFTGDERRWYRGLALVGDDVVPVVSPEAFLTAGELSLLRASAAKSAGREEVKQGAVPA